MRLETYERWILRRALEVYAENQRADARSLARRPPNVEPGCDRGAASKNAYDRANDAERLLERLLKETE